MVYKERVETELRAKTQRIIGIINNRILNTDCTDEVKAFFLKMMESFYSSIMEFSKGEQLDQAKQMVQQCFERADALINLSDLSPIKLGTKLSYAVWAYEVEKDLAKAIQICESSLELVEGRLDELEEDDLRDVKSIIELMKENLSLWKEGENEENK